MSAACVVHVQNGMFDVLNPDPEQIRIEDIAHALSFQCRFNGHVQYHYSVAQHSILVAERVLALTDDPGQAMAGLLHDAAECYLPDVVSPLKPLLLGFKEMENRVARAVAIRFGLPWPEPPSVKRADLEILAAERDQVLSTTDMSAWRELPPAPREIRIERHTPEQIRRDFLAMFRKIERAKSTENGAKMPWLASISEGGRASFIEPRSAEKP